MKSKSNFKRNFITLNENICESYFANTCELFTNIPDLFWFIKTNNN